MAHLSDEGVTSQRWRGLQIAPVLGNLAHASLRTATGESYEHRLGFWIAPMFVNLAHAGSRTVTGESFRHRRGFWIAPMWGNLAHVGFRIVTGESFRHGRVLRTRASALVRLCALAASGFASSVPVRASFRSELADPEGRLAALLAGRPPDLGKR